MKIIENSDDAIALFENAAIRHTEATEIGNYKTANKSYNEIVKSINFLKEHNEINLLLTLLNHTSSGVRNWAATYLLPTEEKKAIKVLKEIAKEEGIRSLAAETTLKEWMKGNLKP